MSRRGYKIVDAKRQSFMGTPKVCYVVGDTYRLPDGQWPVLCHLGFHFCRTALGCLQYASWDEGYRLLEVETTDDALVVDDGSKVATSALTVVADVTADVGRLLTGTYETRLTHRTYTDGYLQARDGEPSEIRIHYHQKGDVAEDECHVWVAWHSNRERRRNGGWLTTKTYEGCVTRATAAIIERLSGVDVEPSSSS
jgi:hypothetical protein